MATQAKNEVIEVGDGSSGDELEAVEFDAQSTDSTSISSSIYKHSYENGRRYHVYRHGRYPIPNDDIEQNREAMKHALVLELRDGKLFSAPIKSEPGKVIDIGCGTGTWAIEMGDKFPEAEVIGVDLSPIQPMWTPSNVRFTVDDVEEEWMYSDFDYVHASSLAPVVKDLPKVLSRCFDNLKPGGWVECVDFSADVRSDDGTMLESWPLFQFWSKVKQAMSTFGIDIQIAPRIGQYMRDAGFINVQAKMWKVPVGTWAKDKTLKLVGMYMRQVTEDFLGAAGAKPFLALGMTEEQIKPFLESVRKALRDDSVHCYGRLFVWTGQKPEMA